jgi:hypothetical protein
MRHMDYGSSESPLQNITHDRHEWPSSADKRPRNFSCTILRIMPASAPLDFNQLIMLESHGLYRQAFWRFWNLLLRPTLHSAEYCFPRPRMTSKNVEAEVLYINNAPKWAYEKPFFLSDCRIRGYRFQPSLVYPLMQSLHCSITYTP